MKSTNRYQSSKEYATLKDIREQCSKQREDVRFVQSVVEREINNASYQVDSVKSVQEALTNLETVDEYNLPRLYQHRLLLDLNEQLVEKSQIKEFKKDRSKLDPSNKMFKWERKAARQYAITFKLQRQRNRAHDGAQPR